MLIEYQNTFDDYREASSAISSVERKRKPSTRATGVAVWLVLWVGLRVMINRLGSPEESGAAWIHVIIPIVAVIAFANAMCIAAVLRGEVKFRVTRRRIIWAVTVAICWLSLWLTHWIAPRTRIVMSWPWSWRLLIPHTTWLLLLAGIGMTVIRGHFRSLSKSWDRQPALRRMRAADISADGVIIVDSDSRLEYRWPCFARWQETSKLFLLVIGGSNYLMLPKRAFAGDEQLKAFRAIARAISGNRMIGFPVEGVAGRTMPAAAA